MIHFFGILEPVIGKRQLSAEAPRKSVFFGGARTPADERDQSEAERRAIDEDARERERFLFQSFSPQF